MFESLQTMEIYSTCIVALALLHMSPYFADGKRLQNRKRCRHLQKHEKQKKVITHLLETKPMCCVLKQCMIYLAAHFVRLNRKQLEVKEICAKL